MNVESILQAVTQQQSAALQADGVVRNLRATRAGQLFTADWKTELVLAGAAYGVTVGGVTTGEAELPITGGGNGTVVDTDEPELQVGTPAGYAQIPLGFMFSGRCDIDADSETASVLLFVDLASQGDRPIAASSTIKTPTNLLDSGVASQSWATSAVTTAITDPTCSHILVYKSTQLHIVTSGSAVPDFSVNWEPSFPMFFRGPCAVYAAWGGTAALSGMCTYYWAEVPLSRIE